MPHTQDPTGTNTLALEGFLPYRLARAAEIVSQRFARVYKERYGLTRPEWRTFATIGQFQKITATEIGRHSAMHKTKVSRAVRSLEKRRWLVRRTDEMDRRIEHLELTMTGARIYRELVQIAASFEADLINDLGDRSSQALDRGLSAIADRYIDQS